MHARIDPCFSGKKEVCVKEFFAFLVANWHLSALFIAILLAIIVAEFQMNVGGSASVSPNELTKLINRSHAAVFDVRDESSFQNGHIVGSVHLSQENLSQQFERLKKQKKKPYIIVDSDGRGFADFLKKFQSEGFDEVFVLKGGISAWKEAGMPLTAAVAANS